MSTLSTGWFLLTYSIKPNHGIAKKKAMSSRDDEIVENENVETAFLQYRQSPAFSNRRRAGKLTFDFFTEDNFNGKTFGLSFQPKLLIRSNKTFSRLRLDY